MYIDTLTIGPVAFNAFLSSLPLQVKVNPGSTPGTLPYELPLLDTLLLLHHQSLS